MMKGNKQLYILVPAVLAIWGIIAYRIIDQVGGNEQPLRPRKRVVHELEPLSDTVIFSLLLDYRDPFEPYRSRKYSQKPKTVSQTTPRPIPKSTNALTPERLIQQYQFKFYGIVESPDKKQKGLISDRSSFHYVLLQEEVDDWKVFFMNPDSIGILVQNQRLYVKR